MNADRDVDPRRHALHPTAEEVDAWAAREHRRRAAWLAGPSEEEKRDWARRYRWRAAVGLGESRLGPTQEDIDSWAEREHGRRQAWLVGPSEAEKRQWMERRRGDSAESTATATSEDEMRAWAAREARRRQEWIAGPTESEKQDWAQRQGGSLLDELLSLPEMLESLELPDSAQRLAREAELAGKGAIYALSRAPGRLWSYLLHAGRTYEEHAEQQPRRRRVRY